MQTVKVGCQGQQQLSVKQSEGNVVKREGEYTSHLFGWGPGHVATRFRETLAGHREHNAALCTLSLACHTHLNEAVLAQSSEHDT